MGYLGTPPQSGFITTAKQRVTSSTNNYVDLDHSISSIADVIVFVNFVKQDTTNLTLTTSTRITLGATLVSSDIVEIHYLGKAVNTQTPGTATVTNDMLAGSIANDKLAGSIANAKLANSSVSINGSTLALGGSLTGIGEDNSPYFLARGDSTQTVSTSTDTTIQFNTLIDSMDSASGFNTSTYKYTVQSGGAGLWYLRAGIYFNSASHIGVGEQVQLQLRHNNSSNIDNHLVRDSSSSLTDGWVFCDGLAKLAVGSEIHLVVWQNTGGNITVHTNNYRNSTIGGFRIKAI